jgi:zinc protease
MMRIHPIKFIVLLGLAAFGNVAEAAAKIVHWQMPQGSRVYYVHTEGLPMVDIQVALMRRDGGNTCRH